MAMKETDTLMEQVAGITECPICSEKLINNRLLPCGHTFCLRCLEQYKKQTNPKGKSLPCPICRKEFIIPKGGCSLLVKNYALEQLTGVQRLAKDNDLVQCDVCDHDRMMVAILFCLQCEQNLCLDCERTHKKMKITSLHHVLPVSKKDQLRHSVDKNICCKEHVDHRLELVCSDCNEPICWKCKSLTHLTHNCVEINEMADQCVEQLKLDFEESENRILMLSKISANIKDTSKQQHEKLEKEKSNIAKISADMIRTIVANEEKLVRQLEAASMRNMNALQPQDERVDKQLENLKEHKTSVKQVVDCGQPWEIFRCTTVLHDRTVELLKLDIIVDIEEISSSNLSDLQIREHLIGKKPVVQAETYPRGQSGQTSNTLLENKKRLPAPNPLAKPTTPSTVTTIGSHSSLEAEPSVKTREELKRVRSFVEEDYVNSQQGQPPTGKEHTLPRGKAVEPFVPVRRFDEEDYVNSHQGKSLTGKDQTLPRRKAAPDPVKQKTTSDWSNTSTVGKITGDCKAIIGVTILKQKVYVIHETSSQIQVYDSDTLNWLSEFKLVDLHEPRHLTSCAVNNCLYLVGLKEQTIYKAESKGNRVLLKLKTEGDSYSVSTTKDGNIILVGFLTQTLKEHTTHGVLLRTIILKPDVSIDINPWHALKLETGNYLICHGKSRVSKHRVCMISPDGGVLQSFGDERGSDMNGLFGPYHLALDEKGNILVADCNNQRIVILSPDLQYVTEIKLICVILSNFALIQGPVYCMLLTMNLKMANGETDK